MKIIAQHSLTCSGRHRFTTSFIELFLKNGLQSPHRLFNAYIEAYTDYYPLDCPNELLVGEPEVQVKVDLRTFDWEKLKKGTYLLPQLLPSPDLFDRPHRHERR
jgi:hypothetical protein